jgi:hypothetical protein
LARFGHPEVENLPETTQFSLFYLFTLFKVIFNRKLEIIIPDYITRLNSMKKIQFFFIEDLDELRLFIYKKVIFSEKKQFIGLPCPEFVLTTSIRTKQPILFLLDLKRFPVKNLDSR